MHQPYAELTHPTTDICTMRIVIVVSVNAFIARLKSKMKMSGEIQKDIPPLRVRALPRHQPGWSAKGYTPATDVINNNSY